MQQVKIEKIHRLEGDIFYRVLVRLHANDDPSAIYYGLDEKEAERAYNTILDANMKEARSNKLALYAQFVMSLAKPPEDIIKNMSNQQAHLWHMLTGVSGEAGELLDSLKKHIIYGKELNLRNIKEELGDLLFYMTGIAAELNFTLDDCIEGNMEKLKMRYPDGKWTKLHALTRLDKDEPH